MRTLDSKVTAIVSMFLWKQNVAEDFGVDVSFPMQSYNVSNNYDWLPHNIDPDVPTPPEYEGVPIQTLGDKQQFYEDYMQGCRDYWGENEGHHCDNTEKDRIEMNIRQPKSMVNYTDVGYKKIKAPEKVFKLLKEFWEQNKDKEADESWFKGSIFVNYWESPSTMVNIEDADLIGGGHALKDAVWESSRETIQQWTGENLVPSSLYGIRVYKENAVLVPHVDRLPLISSAIINVAQDVDEPWPLEVVGSDGVARNITMEPGDLVLYESHSVLHGRPYPLKGKYFANVFIHFEPDPNDKENEKGFPSYILEESEEAKRYLRKSRAERFRHRRRQAGDHGQHESHFAAQSGDIDALMRITDDESEALHAKDNNGWMPIHEAARSGHADVLDYLLKQGADINSVTSSGQSPLALAKAFFDENHGIIDILETYGAIEIGPEL